MIDLYIRFVYLLSMKTNNTPQTPTLHIEDAHGLFTPLELNVLEPVIWGKDNEEVGIIIGRTPRTAKMHIESAMHKLDAQNRTRLVTELFKRRIAQFLCLLCLIQGGTVTFEQNPLRPRSGGTRRTQLTLRFTRSVQTRSNRRTA